MPPYEPSAPGDWISQFSPRFLLVTGNYGPYEFPEKLIPLMITRALADQPLPVYGDGMNVRDSARSTRFGRPTGA